MRWVTHRLSHLQTVIRMTEFIRKPEGCLQRRQLVVVVLGAAVLLYAVHAWRSAFELRSTFSSLPFDACFIPGMVATVEFLEADSDSRVYGPSLEASPFVFQRLSEMLYPVQYSALSEANPLVAGDRYVLLPEDEVPVASEVVCQAGVFRIMKVLP
jgi:hypothetical protein